MACSCRATWTGSCEVNRMGRIELKLDLVMADRRMSLNELADRIGISNVNLSKIKNNKVTAVRFSTLAGICEALKCEPGDILKYVDEA